MRERRRGEKAACGQLRRKCRRGHTSRTVRVRCHEGAAVEAGVLPTRRMQARPLASTSGGHRSGVHSLRRSRRPNIRTYSRSRSSSGSSRPGTGMADPVGRMVIESGGSLHRLRPSPASTGGQITGRCAASASLQPSPDEVPSAGRRQPLVILDDEVGIADGRRDERVTCLPSHSQAGRFDGRAAQRATHRSERAPRAAGCARGRGASATRHDLGAELTVPGIRRAPHVPAPRGAGRLLV